MELHYVKLIFTFTLGSDVSDRYLLFSCRSDFAAAFRRTIPCRRGDCTGCLSAAGCPYPANFEQRIAKDPEAIRRHQKPPLPFVFTFPVLPSPPNRGRALECSLTLFGSAAQEVERFTAATTLLLEGIGASTRSVEAECPGGGRALVSKGDLLPFLTPLDAAGSSPLRPDRVDLAFVTPLRLMQEGRLLKHFRFSHLARALMRRVSSVAYYYEGAAPDLDYRWLSQQSEEVETTASDCRFVSWDGRPAGIIGSARFEGDLEPFHLLLQSGSATHVGKAASFGYGAYRIGS